MTSAMKLELAKWSVGSQIGVQIHLSDDQPQRMVIELAGPIANIPSLKNSKLPGKNFLNRSVLARLKVMDACYKLSLQRAKAPANISFGKEPVTVLVVCGRRKVAFDTDNCFATVRDWMEHPIKKVGKGKNRGWGVGLVENDRQIKGMAVYCKDIGLEMSNSLIVIQRHALKEVEFQNFIRSYFLETQRDD